MQPTKWKRPSPSMIVATVALFVALGGAAYAGFSLPNNSVKSNHIKNGEVKTADLANSAVSSLKIKSNAVNSAKVKNGSLEAVDLSAAAQAALKGAAGTPGAPGAPGAAATKLWAVVSNPVGVTNAVLVRGVGVVSVTESTGVLVRFNQDVSNCSWLANRNATGVGVETAGWAQVGLSGLGNDTVDVRTRDDAGVIADGNFHVAVFC